MSEIVLIVEDDEGMRNMVVEILDLASLHTLLAKDVIEAINILTETEIDLVIADIRMPGASGTDLLRWCNECEKRIPFIMMTGHSEPEIIIEALNLGANWFLTKPFRPNDMLDAIEAALAPVRLLKKQQTIQHEIQDEVTRLRQELIDGVVEKEMLFMGILTSFAKAIDARDSYTHQHSASVAEYAFRTGKAIGLKGAELDRLHTAGTLHDIGKIGVPEAILQKPGRLSDEEYDVIKTHSTRGAEILSPLPDMVDVIRAVRHHHEHFNGRGYPDGLKGKSIPFFARILTVCDAYDAMTTNRPYRKGMPQEKALSILIEERGQQFDPDVVSAFLEIHNANEMLGKAEASPK